MRHRTRTTREQSPWAVMCILIVVILFGMFWLWQKQQINNVVVSEPTPLPVIQHTAQKPQQTPSVNDLEASAANIAVPSFENML